MIDISILIVCYKSRELIVECLRGVHEHTVGCLFEVLLVDCSDDGTVDLVRALFPQVRVIDNTKNLGYGGGNNFLAERAVGTYFVLLNPDTIVNDDAIGELYRTAEAMPTAGAVGGWTRLPNGKRDPACRQFIPTLTRLMIAAAGGARFLNGALAERAEQPAKVETLCGAFMLVRADAWREACGFDTSYFMYSEELDFCVRLRRNGWDVVMTPHAEVIHLVGGGGAQSAKRIQLLTTGQMHFLRKFWSRPSAILGGIALWTHGLIRVLLATFGRVIIGRERARTLRDAYVGIVFQPGAWWNGYDESTRARLGFRIGEQAGCNP